MSVRSSPLVCGTLRTEVAEVEAAGAWRCVVESADEHIPEKGIAMQEFSYEN